MLLSALAVFHGVPLQAAEQIPFRHDDMSSDVGIGRLVLSLVLCLAVLAVAFWYLKRRGAELGAGRDSEAAGFRVIRKVALGPKVGLSVVEFGNQTHLLAYSEQSVTCIDKLPRPSGATHKEG